MSLYKKTLLILLLIFINSCGFRPVYSTANTDSVSLKENLASIKIAMTNHEESNKRLEYLFSNKLREFFNRNNINEPEKYILEIKLLNTFSASAIQQDREITRYNVYLNAQYNLIDKATKKSIKSGTVRRQGGYDAVSSDFATYSSKTDIEKRLTREVAEDLKLEIISVLM